MHSDTAIEEHHHFKVFCYMILDYKCRHFEFSAIPIQIHNISLVIVLILFIIHSNDNNFCFSFVADDQEVRRSIGENGLDRKTAQFSRLV